MTLQVQVLNEREVLAKLEKAGIAPRTVLKAAVEAAAKVIETAAERNAPSPHVEYEFVEQKPTRVSAHVGPDKDHWYHRFFETGTQAHLVTPTSKKALLIGGDTIRARAVAGPIAAKPFLRPAVDNHGDNAADEAGKVIKRAIT